eukprot:COSAG01_NODE_1933_length_8871_cov_12.763338_4_plen_53_part_00
MNADQSVDTIQGEGISVSKRYLTLGTKQLDHVTRIHDRNHIAGCQTVLMSPS